MNNGLSWRGQWGERRRDVNGNDCTGTKMSKRAALYARFSSDLQKDRSIDDQIAVCQTLASRDGLKIVKTFSDRAKSGASMFERDGLLDLMAAAKARKFDVVIVESLDRLSRDQEDLAGLFKRLSFYNVEIRTVNEGTATSIHVGIRGLVGSLFLADLGNKVRRGHNGRVREGKFPGAVTYGYRRVLGKPGEREIDPEQAEVVRRIFREYAAGTSPRTIAHGLTRDGVATANGVAAWNFQTFIGGGTKRGIIGNPLYAGKLVWNTSTTVLNPETGKKTKRRASAEDLIMTEVPHLRIIDQQLWDAANKIRSDRGVAKFGEGGKLHKFIPRGTHLLSGLLRCGACGGHMRIANTSRDGGQRAACAAAHQHGTCQHSKSYDLDVLQRAMIVQVKTRLSDPKAVAAFVEAFQAEWHETDRKNNSERRAVQKRLNNLNVQIDRICNSIRDDFDVPVKLLTAKLKPLEAERVGLDERLRWLESKRNVVAMHPAAAASFQAAVERLHAGLNADAISDECRVAFRNLIESIEVHPTAKRAPYEFTPHTRLGVLVGQIDLFPASRNTAQILGEQGISCIDSVAPEKAGVTQSQQQQVISLGRWRAAA